MGSIPNWGLWEQTTPLPLPAPRGPPHPSHGSWSLAPASKPTAKGALLVSAALTSFCFRRPPLGTLAIAWGPPAELVDARSQLVSNLHFTCNFNPPPTLPRHLRSHKAFVRPFFCQSHNSYIPRSPMNICAFVRAGVRPPAALPTGSTHLPYTPLCPWLSRIHLPHPSLPSPGRPSKHSRWGYVAPSLAPMSSLYSPFSQHLQWLPNTPLLILFSARNLCLLSGW